MFMLTTLNDMSHLNVNSCWRQFRKLNRCLADIRRWMITNKLKINDSKTEFTVFISPQLKCDLSGLSVNVGKKM